MFIVNKIKKRIRLKKIAKEGGEVFSSTLREFFLENYNIKIGYGSYGGCFNKANIPRGTEFGNYCSIAEGVVVFRANHPIDYFTAHPLFYNPKMGYVKKDLLQRPALLVQNDVWIGQNVIILPSCKQIGNGAIIGAGSVVTKDVVPYSIIAGNPAKLIKMRFSEKVIKRLEESQWWLLDKEKLIKRRNEIQSLIDES